MIVSECQQRAGAQAGSGLHAYACGLWGPADGGVSSPCTKAGGGGGLRGRRPPPDEMAAIRHFRADGEQRQSHPSIAGRAEAEPP